MAMSAMPMRTIAQITLQPMATPSWMVVLLLLALLSPQPRLPRSAIALSISTLQDTDRPTVPLIPILLPLMGSMSVRSNQTSSPLQMLLTSPIVTLTYAAHRVTN